MGTPFNDQWVLERSPGPPAPMGALAPGAAVEEESRRGVPLRLPRLPLRQARPRRDRRLKWIDRDT
jgi:hypothetical protein